MPNTEKLKLSEQEAFLLRRVLNEVASGIKIENHESLLGMSQENLRDWLLCLRNNKKDIFLDTTQVSIFGRALAEAIRRLRSGEFRVRVGYEVADAQEIL